MRQVGDKLNLDNWNMLYISVFCCMILMLCIIIHYRIGVKQLEMVFSSQNFQTNVITGEYQSVCSSSWETVELD